MAFKKIEIYKEINLDSRKEILKKICSKEDYEGITDFLDKLANGEVTGKNCTDKRIVKLIDMFSIFLKNSDIPLSKVTKEDLADFKKRFAGKDKKVKAIVKENKELYSDETQMDCTNTIARYLIWKYPEKDFIMNKMPLMKWFQIRAENKTPEILNESEIEKLYNSCKNEAEHYLIAVLFDSGLRPSEFFNIRFQDIIEPTSDSPYYKIDLKEEYSKTEGRTIGLYWKHSTEAIRNYLLTLDRSDPKKQVFAQSYDNTRFFLNRLGRRVLKKPIYFYVFRKSSATYYASRLNRQQLCIRYGWKFSSEMPDTYIKRSGITEDETKNVMLNTDMAKLQKENQDLKQRFDIELAKMQEQMQQLLNQGIPKLKNYKNKLLQEKK